MPHQQQQHNTANTTTDIERRYAVSALEVIKRSDATDAKSRRVGGMALRYNVVYDLGWFSEEIRGGALSDANMSDVVALFNHDPNIPLARNSAGTLTLRNDSEGLHYEFDAPNSPNGDNLLESVTRGDVRASSWAFTVSDYEWEMRDGKDHRVITKIRAVYDVSPVTYPANPDTTVALRSRPQAAPLSNNAATDAAIRVRGLLAGSAAL